VVKFIFIKEFFRHPILIIKFDCFIDLIKSHLMIISY